MIAQAASTVLMVRPASFGFNIQTSGSNYFQQDPGHEEMGLIPERAIKEFDNMVRKLRRKGIQVIVVNDNPLPVKPDAIFPNNWITFHHDGTLVIYPLLAENRRIERRFDILDILQKKYHFDIRNIIDLTGFEHERKFLEGTGSLVFDYPYKIVYAAISPRTDLNILKTLSGQLGFKPVFFEAGDRTGKEIYHTNVMMCVAGRFAVICMESIRKKSQKKKVLDSLQATGKKVIDISMDQVYAFAGNMIELKGNQRKNFLVMSQTAYDSLTEGQLKIISKYNIPLPVKIPLIEHTGGGSARCMIAGVYLPKFSMH